MSTERGKKRSADQEIERDADSGEDRPSSSEIGLGLGGGLGSKRALIRPEKTIEVSSSDPSVKGLTTCVTESHTAIQSHNRRMEEFVSKALQSSSAKQEAYSATLTDGLGELWAAIPRPTRPKANGNNVFSKMLADSRNNGSTIQQLIEVNISTGRALLREVNNFCNTVESFLEMVDKWEEEIQEQNLKMQEELQNEIAAMVASMTKKE